MQAAGREGALEDSASIRPASSFRNVSRTSSKASGELIQRVGVQSRSTISKSMSSTQDQLPLSTFGSTYAVTKQERPGPGADKRAQRQFLDYQLDSLRGKEVLGRFRVLDNVSNRRRGGSPAPRPCDAMH